jgi:hypothetical protein
LKDGDLEEDSYSDLADITKAQEKRIEQLRRSKKLKYNVDQPENVRDILVDDWCSARWQGGEDWCDGLINRGVDEEESFYCDIHSDEEDDLSWKQIIQGPYQSHYHLLTTRREEGT